MIELQNVTIAAGSFRLDNLRFSIGPGEYAVLMGKTGSGKTTILEAICGLRPTVHGTIRLAGREVTHLPPAKRLIGYVPQDLGLFTMMTVRGNLAFAPRRHGRTHDWIDKKIASLAQLLGIEHLLERSVKRLSGGEAQRVALGRALAFEPPCLLLDEPLSALDDFTREGIYDVLRRVREETQVTTLHITHSPSEAQALGTVKLMLADGRVYPTA